MEAVLVGFQAASLVAWRLIQVVTHSTPPRSPLANDSHEGKDGDDSNDERQEVEARRAALRPRDNQPRSQITTPGDGDPDDPLAGPSSAQASSDADHERDHDQRWDRRVSRHLPQITQRAMQPLANGSG